MVPYDAVVMITVAKESAGYDIQPYSTRIDEYIAHMMKYCTSIMDSGPAMIDYRVLLNGPTVQGIYDVVGRAGGIWRLYPGKEPKAAAKILQELLAAVEWTETVGRWRGFDGTEYMLLEDVRRNWEAALAEEMEYEDETEIDLSMLSSSSDGGTDQESGRQDLPETVQERSPSVIVGLSFSIDSSH